MASPPGSLVHRRAVTMLVVAVIATGCGTPTPPSSVSSPVGRTPTPKPASAVPPLATQPSGRIIFDRYDGALGAEAPYLGTFVIRSDGTEERPIPAPPGVPGLAPAWSPDGRHLLFDSWQPPSGPGRPAIADKDGGNFAWMQAPEVDGDLDCDDWSPDGTLLACWVTGDNNPEIDGIYTIRPDGTRLTRLTTSPFHVTEGSAGSCGGGDGRGVFSPDGARIAFIRQRCGTGANPSSDESAAVEIVNRDGSDLHEVVPQGGVKTHPGSQLSWSPDGSLIALGTQAGELFLVRPEGGDPAQVKLPDAIGPHHASGPDWSPEGGRIVFSMYLDSTSSTDLYSIAPDASDLVRLTHADGAEAFARWAPEPGPGATLNP